jgi:hypothetical protein
MTLLVGMAVTIACIALALVGLWMVRRSVELSALQDHHDVAGFFIGVLGVIYAVLLAFVVIVVWEAFEDAKAVVDAEANYLTDVFWLAGGLPDGDRERVQDAARNYARAVIDDEWERMSDGEESPAAHAALDGLRGIYVDMQPAPGSEERIYQESLRRMSDLSDSRSSRLHDSTTGVPHIMWVVLILGGVITVVFTYFFGAKSLAAQSLMTAGLTAMIVLVLYLIAVIDHPFRGGLSVDPDPFESALVEMTE